MTRVFLDTNVLLYRHESEDPAKQAKAREVILSDADKVVSTQVLLEYHANLVRKFGHTREEAQQAVDGIWLETVPATKELVSRAAATASNAQLSIYDAMIVEAAVAAGCSELWSEDLNAGQAIRGVTIVNPFAPVS